MNSDIQNDPEDEQPDRNVYCQGGQLEREKSLSNLSVQVIDPAHTLQELKRREQFWILTLQTYVPKGLNFKYTD